MLRQLEKVAAVDAHEGPVYAGDEDALYFTSLPAGREHRTAIRRLALATGELTTVAEDANAANGMWLGRDGALLVCEQGGFARPARISRLDRRSGAVRTVTAASGGAPLNSPNDVVEGPDGAIWFTDPAYGFLQGFRPRPRIAEQVHRHDPASGRTKPVAAGFDHPNGIALSPDGSALYVTDSGAPRHVRAFEITGDRLAGGRVAGGRVFARSPAGEPDGLKTDAAGRVLVSSARGVEIHALDGEHLELIPLPGAVNFCWGGPRSDVLFITTDDAVYAAEGA